MSQNVIFFLPASAGTEPTGFGQRLKTVSVVFALALLWPFTSAWYALNNDWHIRHFRGKVGVLAILGLGIYVAWVWNLFTGEPLRSSAIAAFALLSVSTARLLLQLRYEEDRGSPPAEPLTWLQRVVGISHLHINVLFNDQLSGPKGLAIFTLVAELSLVCALAGLLFPTLREHLPSHEITTLIFLSILSAFFYTLGIGLCMLRYCTRSG